MSACLLRDGAIAYAIAKERITRVKHAPGFYKEVIDYCLEAEGITLDDVDLIVRNCYILPVGGNGGAAGLFRRAGFPSRIRAARSVQASAVSGASDKVVTISHHLAHAYSAFAVSPFDEGVVMIVDGVGSYRSDVMESFPSSDVATPLARESESYYKFKGSTLECLKKVFMEPDRGFLSDEFYNMPGLGALYSRASTYIFGDWNKCGELMGLAPYGRHEQVKHLLELDRRQIARAALDHRFQATLHPGRQQLGKKPGDAALGGSGLAGAGRHRKRAARPRPLAA